MTARLLLVLAGASAGWALRVLLGGGFDLNIAGRTIASNDPVRPLLLAGVAFAAYASIAGPHAIRDRWSRRLDRIGDGRLALLLAIGVTVLGILYSATAGIASDGYGYVSQADLWTRGNLVVPEPSIAGAPWPEPEWTFAPLGYQPVQSDGAWSLVPLYSAGLPMIMAVARIIGGQEFMYWVVPAFGGLLTWMTYGVGRRLGSSRAGLLACWLVSTSPVFLLMLMQPMSDVPVAAAWTTAIFFAIGRRTGKDAAFSGLTSALAILIRPNLAAIAGVLWLWWLVRPEANGDVSKGRSRLHAPLVYFLCVVPGVLTTGAVYQWLYGSPLTSGYGDLGRLFSWQHIVPNVRLYLTWFVESQGRLSLVGLAALLLPARFLWRWVSDRRALWMILGCLAVLVLQYLAYLVFDGWFYLRFLLTCWPFVMLGVAAAGLALSRSSKPVVSLLVGTAILALGVQGLQHARSIAVFRVWYDHRRPVDFAHVVARETPASSVIYTLGHSGTLRYYAGRTTLRTDVLNPDWLDVSVDWLRSRGRAAYLVLEDSEVASFKQRYAGESIVAMLDARLKVIYGGANPYRLYDLTGNDRTTPRVVEVANLHALRSALPDPHAFVAQLGAAGVP